MQQDKEVLRQAEALEALRREQEEQEALEAEKLRILEENQSLLPVCTHSVIYIL